MSNAYAGSLQKWKLKEGVCCWRCCCGNLHVVHIVMCALLTQQLASVLAINAGVPEMFAAGGKASSFRNGSGRWFVRFTHVRIRSQKWRAGAMRAFPVSVKICAVRCRISRACAIIAFAYLSAWPSLRQFWLA